MGKHDHPNLQFVVERGKLSPAGPYEAEALSTYSNGAKLTVTLHQKRSLPLLRKYWSVLRDVVNNCSTPWDSPDEASDALKLALGVTDISKTVSGKWFIRPGSISFNSMDEAEFRDFYDKAMGVLAEVTGIDPDELRSRYSEIPESEPAPSSPGSDDSGNAPAAENPPSPSETSSPQSGGGGPSDEERREAYADGREAKRRGLSKKAMPKKFRDDPDLMEEWLLGYDECPDDSEG